MASVTLRSSDRLPVGTVVSAYPAAGRVDGAAPQASSVDTATVQSDGSLTFDGLLPSTRYVAYAQVDGQHRYVAFGSDPLLATIVNVAAKGATGDDIADDTTAFTEAAEEVHASGGGIVYIPRP